LDQLEVTISERIPTRIFSDFNLQDVRLKIAILEFIATAVETQPGLIELFLNLKEKDKNSQVMAV
jgi:hypothetical protein